jgi:hypothetical protein
MENLKSIVEATAQDRNQREDATMFELDRQCEVIT